MVQWFCLVSWRPFDVWTSLFGIMNQYDSTFDLKINVGHCDLYFMVKWFCVISCKTNQCMNIIIWGYEWVWPKVWPQNKYRLLWPIFHIPSDFALCLEDYLMYNIILWDYGSYWPDVWPQNKCRSIWPIFHGPVILSYISKTIWCMSVIFSDIETVWPKIWPQSKYKSMWPIFHGLVIWLYIFKIIWWMNIKVGIMDQCDT